MAEEQRELERLVVELAEELDWWVYLGRFLVANCDEAREGLQRSLEAMRRYHDWTADNG